ncbi:MAG: Gfo/Idh/MocA family oxidoreductase [Trueperaceae bacterium]|nr:Gfo/Idh/MocA family oxidoreductase [Trueperaceae bacterium]
MSAAPRPIRTLLVGAGLMGAFHARTLASTIGVVLHAVVDADGDAATRVARDVDAPDHGVDAVAAIADEEIDAVVIASPAATHGALIEIAAAAGKAIFCEKPLGVTLDEATRVARIVAAAGVPFQIGFQRRFDPGTARLLALTAAGGLGTIETFRSMTADPTGPTFEAMSRSAGIFHDTLSHDMDLALAICGDIEEVATLGASMTDARFADIGKPDTTIITLRFASGALGVIENRLRTGYGYETVLEVGGSGGKGVVRDDALDSLTLFRDDRIERAHVPWFLERFAEAYRGELSAFFAAVRAGRAPDPGIAQGLRVLAACEAAERSYREGHPCRPHRTEGGGSAGVAS